VKLALLPLGAALALAGCAKDRVTLLDNEDPGEQFAIADITDPGNERALDAQLTELDLGSKSRPRTLSKVRKSDVSLIGSLPPKAREFQIVFPVGSSRIPLDQRGRLEEIRNELAIRPGAQIEVAGFTDSLGDEALNNGISLDRARGVADELRQFGFAVAADDVIGRGEYDARAALGDEKADDKFRRAVVIVR
jgi:outer membrane protein OmpA-like peptidoglycan-associated protein